MRVRLAAWIALILLFLCSCSGEDGSASLVLHPKEKELTLGLPFLAATHLSVEVRPADADVLLKWSSSNEKVATVDERGFVTALTPGTARISVRDAASGAKSVCILKIRTAPQSLSIRTTYAALKIGDKLNLSPKLSPAPHIPNIYKMITWSSSDTEIAAVDARGRVTAVGPGEAAITGQTINEITQTCVVTVMEG